MFFVLFLISLVLKLKLFPGWNAGSCTIENWLVSRRLSHCWQWGIYSTFQKLCTWFALCHDSLWFCIGGFTHNILGYFTGSGGNLCDCSTAYCWHHAQYFHNCCISWWGIRILVKIPPIISPNVNFLCTSLTWMISYRTLNVMLKTNMLYLMNILYCILNFSLWCYIFLSKQMVFMLIICHLFHYINMCSVILQCTSAWKTCHYRIASEACLYLLLLHKSSL